MEGTGVIDRFLDLFARYIDSGFGLIHGEVGFLASSLIVIDVTLAFLFWTWGEGETSSRASCARRSRSASSPS